jgi:coenzyme F420-reducing hydrogenase beta subunit
LRIRFNTFGEYNPVREKECIKECGLCLKVCPFADGNENEDDLGKRLYGNTPAIRHRPETGYFLDSYIGYAPDTRNRGSSGGMATWLLSTLLKRGIVDHIITVIPNDDPDQLFRFAILDTTDSVLRASGSVYYPVTLSDVLREIQNKPGKCAIIGVPCFIKAVRLAQKIHKNLRDQIVMCIGLICGQQKTQHYTSYIARHAGVKGRVKKVYYRGKNPDYPTSNYYYSFEDDSGNSENIFWNAGISEAWLNRWFTPNPCNYCDDVFAEGADAAFMDAWLPEYSEDRKGTNIFIVRSQKIHELIESAIKENGIRVDPIPIEKVMQSQAGVINIKRHYLAYQLYLGNQKGLKTPKKRIAPLKLSDPFTRQKIRCTNQMQEKSHRIWDPEKQDAERFRAEMQPYLVQVRRWNRVSEAVGLPLNATRDIIRKIRRL